ncbi:MerR family transcriptional regulator [Cohnella sp. GCM10027633]|uniref:MerR family transcriptional regulator n=1 Tax=unclassified Cohnella TaxID=2636738 RepID=UPI00364011C8
MPIRPIDIARRLNVSTSALRHYESWEVLPPIDRGPNGYRIYTETHVAYFECIRSMYPGYGMTLTCNALRLVRDGRMDEALWSLNEQQAKLWQDKTMTEKTIQMLETRELDEVDAKSRRKGLTIGEVSEETSIPASAIRHWEKEGLLTPDRDPHNGYRTFTRSHVRQALMIRTLRNAGYPLDVVSQVMRELNNNQLEQARRIARESLNNMYAALRHQLMGSHDLYKLCRMSGLSDKFAHPMPNPYLNWS